MNHAEKAELYRNQQPEKLLQLFQADNGRQPKNAEELTSWAASPKGRALIDAHLDEEGKIDPINNYNRLANQK